MNPAIIRHFEQVRDTLLAEYPELAEDDRTLLDTIDGENGLQDRLRGMVRAARQREADAEACKSLAKQIMERAARLNAGADKLRNGVKAVMGEAGIKKLAAPDFTATLSPSRPAVIVTDESKLPTDCFRVKREPDKARIKELFDAGESIPGASLSNGGMTLTVRTA